MKGKTARHLYHLIAGCVPPTLGLVLARDWLLPFLGTVAAIFVLIESVRLISPPVNRRITSLFSGLAGSFKQAEAARPIGTTYYVVASFLVFLFFPRDIAATALFYAAVGDAVAAAIGERLGRAKLGTKSLEGTTAFFVSSLGVGAILILAGLQLTWAAVAVGALAAALVELAPIPVDDNLTVPIVAAGVMALMLSA